MEKTAEQLRREQIALEGDTHGKNKWAILFTVLIMTFMVCLDSTVVTVALPVMQKELGVGLDRIQLVSSVYLLATCVAMLPFGRLGDVRGKVNVFQLGVIVFTYDHRKEKTLEGKFDKFFDNATQYFTKTTDKELYQYRNILEYVDGEYKITNPITNENIVEMRNNMDDSDREEFDQFIEKHWKKVKKERKTIS